MSHSDFTLFTLSVYSAQWLSVVFPQASGNCWKLSDTYRRLTGRSSRWNSVRKQSGPNFTVISGFCTRRREITRRRWTNWPMMWVRAFNGNLTGLPICYPLPLRGVVDGTRTIRKPMACLVSWVIPTICIAHYTLHPLLIRALSLKNADLSCS